MTITVGDLDWVDSMKRRGFTLLEMMVTLTVLALVATAAMPLFRDDQRLRALAAVEIMRADIEFAQTLSIAYPAEPITIRFDLAKQEYWLALQDDPNEPIERPDNGEPYVVKFGEGRAASALGVTFALENATNDSINFDNTGALTDFTFTPEIAISSSAVTITLSIAPMTGTISEIETAK